MVNYHNNINKRFYECTKYPKVFKGTYWGNFINSKLCNNFITKYNIKKRINYYPKNIKLELVNLVCGDYTEIYLTNDKKYILIKSPYSQKDFIENNKGCGHVDKLYDIDAFTFMKVIQMNK